MHKGIFRISVRQLVEFILRSGDIDASYRGAVKALEGTKAHQRIQKDKKREAKENGLNYRSEVSLSHECTVKDIVFRVEGRADGIWQLDEETVVEEIKSTLRPLEQLEKNTDHWHWAQAKCYGYMYAQTKKEVDDSIMVSGGKMPQNIIDSITIALIYCHAESGDTITFTEVFSVAELEEFYKSLLERYWDYAGMDMDRRAERDETARALSFPYGDYRPGQRELAVSVFATIKQKRKLFAQAPTGIGKTISTLFPAVKSLPEGLGEKIFYLTAKVVARQVAEDALKHMAKKGLRMRAITLTARDKICFCETRKCNPEDCVYAKGHFDRINEAILDCVRHELMIDRGTVERYAHKHTVCPAEYQLDLSLFCDTVICDYNHAYDPKARIQRFFQLGGDYILLNDEAHNLIDRAREMFSTGLFRNDFTTLRKELGRKHPLYRIMGDIAKTIRKQWAEQEDREPFTKVEHPAELIPLLADFAGEADIWLNENPQHVHTEPVLNLYFSVLDYLKVSDLYDERYVFYCEPANGYIRLYCLDPSYLLHNEQKKSRACVFFSATLTPLPYFRALLGGNFDDYTLRLASPFPRDNLCLMVDGAISTKYKDRANSYEAVADRIFALINGRTGNYMAFFSSYVYLSEVYGLFIQKYPHVKTLMQTQDLDDEGKEAFLACFKAEAGETLLAFVVLGGVFSEGIDLKGERLIGAAIVGVGMPLISAERNVISDYYNRFDNTGFAFAYTYPGMNKVLQAAGRVIRTETDRGVVMLIDSRYPENTYRALFPPEWDGYVKLKGLLHIQTVLTDFWA